MVLRYSNQTFDGVLGVAPGDYLERDAFIQQTSASPAHGPSLYLMDDKNIIHDLVSEISI